MRPQPVIPSAARSLQKGIPPRKPEIPRSARNDGFGGRPPARLPAITLKHRGSVGRLRVVYEDPDILVVDKPAGLLSSTVAREKRPTVAAMLRDYLADSDPRARLGIIHRLDRDASGLLVFSKNDRAYRSLKAQFFHHSVERVYEAVVHGVPEPRKGRIESRLVEYVDGSVHSTRHRAKGQIAVTDYEVVEALEGRAVLRVRLETGRKHQIRAHLSEKGWPILGDRMYGRGASEGELRLRAVRLGIDHPRTGERMIFEAQAS